MYIAKNIFKKNLRLRKSKLNTIADSSVKKDKSDNKEDKKEKESLFNKNKGDN